jgi:CO/xanthine dehydrogenase FAD-binding subunit
MSTAAAETEVLLPTSRDEAIKAFGAGEDITVVAGGTIVMPEIAMGRLRPRKTLMLARAGLDGLRRQNGRVAIGAMTPVAALKSAPEPLAAFAGYVADFEVRAQATVGGNICAPPKQESPRGDLQPALLALDAQVRSAGTGGERTEPLEQFLAAGPAGRLVLEVEFDEPTRGAASGLGRPHAHSYTILSVACAETAGAIRVAVGGAGPHGLRCPSVEQALADGADPASAAQKVLEDVQPRDDALASAWYRSKMLPVLVRRALDDL